VVLLNSATRAALVLVCLGLAPAGALRAEGPAVERLLGPWTGIHLERNQRNKVTLTLSAPSAPANPRGGATAASGAGAAVSGSFTFDLAQELRRGGNQPPPRVEPIQAQYFATSGVLRIGRAGGDLLAVLNADATQMAVLYTGAAANTLPMVLAAGTEPPRSLASIGAAGARAGAAPGASMSPADMIAIAKANREQQAEQRAANQEYQKQVMSLQQEMAQAARSRDTARVQQIQKKLSDLAMQYRAGSAQRAPGNTPAARGSCPERITKWAAQLDERGASAEQFGGLLQVANMFRPSAFTPFFGKPFAALSADERGGITTDLRIRCKLDGSAFGRGGNITAIESAFADTAGFKTEEAASAGLALELIGEWAQRSVAGSGTPSTFQQAADFALHSKALVQPLWPKEATALRERAAAVLSDRAAESLEQRIAAGAGRASTDRDALRELGELRYGEQFRALDEADRARVNERYRQSLDSALTARYTAAQRSFSSGNGRASLVASKRWYSDNTELLVTFADQPATERFLEQLGAQREAAYRSAFDSLSAEIAGAATRANVAAFGQDFFLTQDEKDSPTWRELRDRQRGRLAAVDREAYLARVGQGPFRPDYPGAPYLNALYRNDTAQLDREDRALADAMFTLVEPMLSLPLMNALPMLSGGLVSADAFRNGMRASLARTTMAKQLAALFVISYEYAYPSCMDPMPKHYKKTSYYETVYKNGYGNVLWRDSRSSVTYYNINARHEALFLKVDGESQSGEGMDFFTSIFSNFLPGNVNVAMNELSDNLRGVTQAMHDRPCDDAVIRQLEQNMIARTMNR
jgi:hypothetical protein